jgi:hypothetical protein
MRQEYLPAVEAAGTPHPESPSPTGINHMDNKHDLPTETRKQVSVQICDGVKTGCGRGIGGATLGAGGHKTRVRNVSQINLTEDMDDVFVTPNTRARAESLDAGSKRKRDS